jgi:type IV pilus assembly protein PilC
MPTFKYSAVGPDGRTVRGNLDASDQTALLDELRKRSLTPLRVEAKSGARSKPAKQKKGGVSPAVAKAAAANEPKGGLGSIQIGGNKPGVRKKEEIVIFTRQLATMIGAGIPMLESLEILREQAASRQFRLLLAAVLDDVRSGQDLSTSFGRWEGVFSDVYISMIKAGEASGQLDDILGRLADYMEASERLKRDIKSAMTYPVVSLALIFAITAFLMLSIVPKFKEVFASMGIELPALTRGVLAISDFCSEYWMMIGVGMVFLYLVLNIYKKTDRGSYQVDWLLLHMPVFGDLFQKVGLSRFAKTFSTMLKSGVPILGALEIVADTSGNRIVSDAVLAARENVRQGEGLAGPLSESPVFPPMVTRMVGIGEKTGSLEVLLEKISEFYDEQVSATVKQLTSLIEPIMIATMGVVVGTICLSVFLPIFELQKQLASR